MGHQKQNELYKSTHKVVFFVMMSIQDGFGMVLTQAMSSGLPIITSTNTGGPDLVSANGEEGFVIDIRDVDTLKEKLLFLYSNPDKCKLMGQKAKAKVSEGFSWDDYGSRYIKNLEVVLKNKKV